MALRARAAARASRRALRHPVLGRRRDRTGQAAEAPRSPRSGRGADLPRRHRADERRARGRDRRRLAADLLLAGAVRATCTSPTRARLRGARRPTGRVRCRPDGAGRRRRRRPGVPRLPEAAARALRRRHGRPRGQNFYNRLARRYGYEAEAATIQDLYLDGRRTTPRQPSPTRSSTRSPSSATAPGSPTASSAWRASGVPP